MPLNYLCKRHNRVNHKRLRCCLTLLACTAVAYIPRSFTATIDKPSLEYQVKASLIFNILHYVEFPPSVPADSPRQNELTICFDSFDHYGNAVQALEGELVNGKSIRIREFKLAEMNQCNAVVFSHEELQYRRMALQTLKQKSILTIGEDEEFIREGGVVRFAIIASTVQFDINEAQAKNARLNISSKLLRLARHVATEP